MAVLETPRGSINIVPVNPVSTLVITPDGREYLVPRSWEQEKHETVILAVLLADIFPVRITRRTYFEMKYYDTVKAYRPDLVSDDPLDSVKFNVLAGLLFDLHSTLRLGPAMYETVQEMVDYVERLSRHVEEHCRENHDECAQTVYNLPSDLLEKVGFGRIITSLEKHYGRRTTEKILGVRDVSASNLGFNRKEHALFLARNPERAVRELNYYFAMHGCRARLEKMVPDGDSYRVRLSLVLHDGPVVRTGHYDLRVVEDELYDLIFRTLPFDTDNRKDLIRERLAKLLEENGYAREIYGTISVLVFEGRLAICKPNITGDNCHVFESYDEFKEYVDMLYEPVPASYGLLKRAGTFIPDRERERLLITGCFNCNRTEKHGRITVSERNGRYVISVPEGGTRKYFYAYSREEEREMLERLARADRKGQPV